MTTLEEVKVGLGKESNQVTLGGMIEQHLGQDQVQD